MYPAQPWVLVHVAYDVMYRTISHCHGGALPMLSFLKNLFSYSRFGRLINSNDKSGLLFLDLCAAEWSRQTGRWTEANMIPRITRHASWIASVECVYIYVLRVYIM